MTRSVSGITVARYYLALNKSRSSREFVLINEGKEEQG